MVLPDNVRPESSILYLSSFILKVLSHSTNERHSVSSLFDMVNKQHDISIHDYLLCLDWLFLMDFAYADEKGMVKLCS